MKSLIKRYQIVIFFVLTFIISWFPWYTGGHGFKTWGPSLAGLIVVAAVQGRKGIREMFRRLLRWRVGIIWWGVALLAPFALTLVAVGIHVLAGGEVPPFTLWKEEWYLAPVLMLILLLPIGGPGGEEPFGWRGYAQPMLQKKWGKWGPLIASFIIGIVWSVWHLPEFFNPASSQYALGLGFFVPLIVAWIANSIIMTWLYNRTGGSVLIAGVMYHLMVDVSATFLVDFTLTGMMKGEVVPKADLRLIGIETAVFALAALFLVVATKGRLGYSEKEDKQE